VPRYPSTTPTLFIIGGAEDRVGKASLLRHFLKLAGGRRARLVLIPTASSFQDEVVASYTEVFTRLGAPGVQVVNPATRAESHDPDLVALVDDATGIFMSGGSQLRLSQLLPGTPLGEALHRAHDRGAVVGGTSAGASAVSEHMIAFGDDLASPRQGAVTSAAGLGLLADVVVDQHFAQRNRYGRLLSIVGRSPRLLGLGIDEDTAAVVRGGRELEVVGSGCVFVADGSQAVSDAHLAEHGAPLLVSGVVVHTLPAGARFDLAERRLLSFVEEHLAHQIKHQTEED
jgi:cyanophycinase